MPLATPLSQRSNQASCRLLRLGIRFPFVSWTGFEPSSAVSALLPAVVWYQGPIISFFRAPESERPRKRIGSPPRERAEGAPTREVGARAPAKFRVGGRGGGKAP